MIASNPVPLCSDANSNFLESDPFKEEHNKVNFIKVSNYQEVMDALQRLKTKVIPEAAKEYDTLTVEDKQLIPLCLFVHRKGINLRHLGLFRNHLMNTENKMAVLLEMVARVIKIELKEALRTGL